jgi:hypothetical protein
VKTMNEVTYFDREDSSGRERISGSLIDRSSSAGSLDDVLPAP